MHPLVELMLKRMESHPEEFRGGTQNVIYDDGWRNGGYRWAHILDEMQQYLSDEDSDTLRTALGSIKLDRLHNEALDELLNGDERRRKQAEEREREKQAYMAQAQYASGAQAYPPNMYTNALANALNNQQTPLNDLLNSGSLKYRPGPDTYEEVNTGMTYTRAHLEDNPGLVAKLRKALGL